MLSSMSKSVCRKPCRSMSSIPGRLKGAGGSADLKTGKYALLSLNHHNFSNTELIYTDQSFYFYSKKARCFNKDSIKLYFV